MTGFGEFRSPATVAILVERDVTVSLVFHSNNLTRNR